MPTNALSRRTARRGFTLLEMMLVVLIIGMLSVVGVIAIGANLERARKGTTVSALSQIKSALQSYQMTNATYPATLDVLVPSYLESIPMDGWKHAFIYRPQSSSGLPGQEFDLYSMGKNGTPSDEDDLNVWTMSGNVQPTGQ
ncbi:type II secretion system major pseudopilin GspG [soil metagenome]